MRPGRGSRRLPVNLGGGRSNVNSGLGGLHPGRLGSGHRHRRDRQPGSRGRHGEACVFTPAPTREALLKALRARHCHGTTAAKIFLDVRVNGRLMGDKMAEPAAGPVTVEIVARCPLDIERVEVCRNNRFIYSKRPEGREAALAFVDREPLEGRCYYDVRVIQKDEEIAWSSPVWFGAK